MPPQKCDAIAKAQRRQKGGPIIHIHPHQRKRDVKRLLGEIRAETLQLQNQIRAIPRSDPARKRQRELLQDTIDDKEYAMRMLQDELRTLSDI